MNLVFGGLFRANLAKQGNVINVAVIVLIQAILGANQRNLPVANHIKGFGHGNGFYWCNGNRACSIKNF